jgi:DNA-binding MarR family transcriptional regulator
MITDAYTDEALAQVAKLLTLLRSYRAAHGSEGAHTAVLETDDHDSWIAGFAEYLVHEVASTPTPVDAVGLGVAMVACGNRVRRQASRVLRESPFASLMDVQFLFALEAHGTMTKSTLIDANGMEPTSGTEVLRRLVAHGWIDEEPNPEDGRSKIVSLSHAGRAVLDAERERFSHLYASLTDRLSEGQRRALLEILHTLALT